MAASTRGGGASPSCADVVIVGNGPSAMILSYILHGNIPFYNPNFPHPDPLLHDKLKGVPQLLHLDIRSLTDHFEASRFSYSTQALPLNSLVDALVRPGGETDDTEENTCVEWHNMPDTAVSHVVLGDAVRPGGQWTECPADAKGDIQSLSYAGMLSLPGYSFHEHHRQVHGTNLPPFTRPSRREMSEYLAAYPAAVGINESFRSAEWVGNVTRLDGGFYIGSHNIQCKHIVLASGIFTEAKPARPLLQPLLNLEAPSIPTSQKAPMLVIGSGFSAADIIISAPADQKIIHIFKWESDTKPSPLKGCHQQAYPEYAGVYRLMKRAATASHPLADGARRVQYPSFRPRTLTPFLKSREWGEIYEGLPNTRVIDVNSKGSSAVVTLRLQDGTTFTREVSGLAYAVGRRGSLKYLDKSLRGEIIKNSPVKDDALISAGTLRTQALTDLEVANDVFAIGSLTGDSLIRFAYGGCFYVAGKLVSSKSVINSRDTRGQNGGNDKEEVAFPARAGEAMNGTNKRCSRDPSDVTMSKKSWRGSAREVQSFDDVNGKRKSARRSLWGSCFFACR